jgi:hypothetical protein
MKNSFVLEANGPDMKAARFMPPSASLETALSAGPAYARQGLSQDRQELMVGVVRRVPLDDLRDILSCSAREEALMLREFANSLPMAGPTPAYGLQPSLGAPRPSAGNSLPQPRPRLQ